MTRLVLADLNQIRLQQSLFADLEDLFSTLRSRDEHRLGRPRSAAAHSLLHLKTLSAMMRCSGRSEASPAQSVLIRDDGADARVHFIGRQMRPPRRGPTDPPLLHGTTSLLIIDSFCDEFRRLNDGGP